MRIRLVTLFICLLSLIGTCASAQCGTTGDTLLVENDADLWALSLCDSIWGSLHINHWDVSNLDSLQNLLWIEEHFILDQNISLLDVDGLINLHEIGGDLIVKNNFTIQYLNGLNGLTQLGGDLIIKGNITLVDINAFSGMTVVAGELKIQENHTLEGLTGFENITQIQGNCLLQDQNLVLDDLSGLSGLQQIAGDLEIMLPYGTSVDGLESLQTVGGEVRIMEMELLANLNGLSALASVTGSFEIADNGSLVQINGLENLLFVGADLNIHDNGSLLFCCGIEPIIVSEGIVGELILYNNANNCNTAEEIVAECMDGVPLTFTVGRVELLEGGLRIDRDKAILAIYNLAGKIVKRQPVYGHTLNKLELDPGYYVLQIAEFGWGSPYIKR